MVGLGKPNIIALDWSNMHVNATAIGQTLFTRQYMYVAYFSICLHSHIVHDETNIKQ